MAATRYTLLWLFVFVSVSVSETTHPKVLDRPSCRKGATVPVTRVNTADRLASLRNSLNNVGAHAYIVSVTDPHGSSYVAEYDKRLCYISGLCGSAGTAVITAKVAAVWTDGRYFLEAEESMDCNWILMKQGVKGVPKIEDWLGKQLNKRNKVSVDPRLVSIKTFEKLQENLKKYQIQLISDVPDLVDEVWKADKVNVRPAKPNGPISIHDLKFAGVSWEKKIKNLREDMSEKSVDAIVISRLEEIAWLYNLRGKDIVFTPVFLAYSIVTKTSATLYLRDSAEKLKNVTLRKHLDTKQDGKCPGQSGECVEVFDYEQFYKNLPTVVGKAELQKVSYSPMTNYMIKKTIPEVKRFEEYSAIAFMKEVKNEVERKAMKRAYIKDGVALVSFFELLEREVKQGIRWTEMDAVRETAKIMKEQEYNESPSFYTIAGSGAHGAIIHYRPSNITDKQITTKEMYLQDCGGQYLDGTTDTTRTFHFGTPTDYEKEAYTRVLMGSIDLALSVWAQGVTGYELDSFARRPLWEVGMVYRHGTGHGIGQYLGIHEGPAYISKHRNTVDSSLRAGMFLSDEPGYYEDGKFGVRLETVVMVEEVKLKYQYKDLKYFRFQPVALVPFEPHLINVELLSARQLSWLNDYHQKVETDLGAELRKQGRTAALKWVKARTSKLYKSGGVSVTRGAPVLLVAVTMALVAY